MRKDRTVIGLNLPAFLMMIGVGMIVALFPQRIIDFDGDGRRVGYVASMFALSYIAFQVPVGALADRFGFKRFIALGYLLCFFAGLGYYFSSGSIMIFLGRLIQGAGEAPVWALAPALLSVKFSSDKGSSIGLYNARCYVGLTAGPILSVFLINRWRYENMFLLYAFACLAGAVLTLWLVEDVRPNGESPGKVDFSGVREMARDGAALLTLIGITVYGAGYGVFVTALPVFLMSEKCFGHSLVSAFFSLFYIAISIAQLTTGRASDRFGPSRFMALGLLFAAIGTAAAPFLFSIRLLAALTLASAGLGVFYLASMIFLNETVDERLKGTISGAYYLFFGVGLCFGPPLFSLVMGMVGCANSLICLAALFAAFSAIMAAGLRRFGR